MTFVVVLMFSTRSVSQTLPGVVNFLNGTIGVALDSLEADLRIEDKRLSGNGYGIHELYSQHGVYTMETDINDEYITKAYFVPYKEQWFDDQHWSEYEIEEQETEQYADHIFMYRKDEMYFYRVKTMEGQKQLAIWYSNE
jgi:hypothetical protein